MPISHKEMFISACERTFCTVRELPKVTWNKRGVCIVNMFSLHAVGYEGTGFTTGLPQIGFNKMLPGSDRVQPQDWHTSSVGIANVGPSSLSGFG